MKVALVHDYLVQYGGAEKTLEAILELFPEAVIYTGMYQPQNMPATITSKTIVAPRSRLYTRFSKYLTLRMPLVFEGFDLSDYDLVISDGTAWAKSVLTNPDQMHISYIHTPPRFLYGYSVESQKRDKWYFRPFVNVVDTLLRIWDYVAAQRPDYLVTNSKETQKRIRKFYQRESTVIYPPVDTSPTYDTSTLINLGKTRFADLPQPYYLALGRLAAYKNFDLLIQAFNKLKLTLVVAGTGAEEENLKRLTHKNVYFTGKVSEEEKYYLFENCSALINPVVDEDFGIVPIEAMAHGKPIFAHNSGGHKESIQHERTGYLYNAKNSEEFAQEFRKFENTLNTKGFDKDIIKEHAQTFNKERFKKELADFIATKNA